MEITLFNKEMKAVVTTHGAELIDLRDGDDKAYIWSGDSAYWPGRNPLLFPIVGNLKNNRIMLDDQEWQMNRHGFARDQEFQIVEQADDFVVLELKETEETMMQYPRKFVLQVKHSLNEDGFTTEYKVINQDDKMMPFCIGAHTAFHCPLNSNECFEDYEIVFDKEETVHNILLNENGYIIGAQKSPPNT